MDIFKKRDKIVGRQMSAKCQHQILMGVFTGNLFSLLWYMQLSKLPRLFPQIIKKSSMSRNFRDIFSKKDLLLQGQYTWLQKAHFLSLCTSRAIFLSIWDVLFFFFTKISSLGAQQFVAVSTNRWANVDKLSWSLGFEFSYKTCCSKYEGLK